MTVYWPNGSLERPRVSSDFNPARRNPVTGIVQPHNGIDLVGWVDNCSPVDGTVIFAGYNGAAGNEVRIRADGPTAFHVGDCYRILHHASLYVRTGQRVSARQPVGRMGTTGQSTGVHCHFETHEWRLWNPVNPTDYMRRANVGAKPAGGGAKPLPVPPPPPPPPIPEEVLNMATRFITTHRNGGTPIADDKRRGAFVDTESGFECSISWFTLEDAEAFARAAAGNDKATAVRLSDAGFDKFVASLAAVRAARK